MGCDAADDLIEALAAGDAVADAAMAAHVDGCAYCRGRLDRARAIEVALAARPTPEPPPRFVVEVMTRIRRERWRAEQLLDAGFNIAVGFGALFIAAGIGGLLWISGVLTTGGDLVSLAFAGASVIAERFAREAQTIALVAVFFTAAVGVWWWMENEAAI